MNKPVTNDGGRSAPLMRFVFLAERRRGVVLGGGRLDCGGETGVASGFCRRGPRGRRPGDLEPRAFNSERSGLVQQSVCPEARHACRGTVSFGALMRAWNAPRFSWVKSWGANSAMIGTAACTRCTGGRERLFRGSGQRLVPPLRSLPRSSSGGLGVPAGAKSFPARGWGRSPVGVSEISTRGRLFSS